MRAREVRASVVNKASLQFNQTPSWLCRCHKAFTRCSPWSSYAASYALTIHVDRPEHSKSQFLPRSKLRPPCRFHGNRSIRQRTVRHHHGQLAMALPVKAEPRRQPNAAEICS